MASKVEPHREWAGRPVAIIRTIGQRRVVLDVSDAAMRHGIKPGMTAAEARALHGQLFCFDDEPAIDRRALEALGRWLTRFTPVVSCEWADDDDNDDPPAALWLDLTGCEPLFGSVTRIVNSIAQALRRFNISASMAVAPTVGSAWAFASTTRSSPLIISSDELLTAVRSLPVMSLRLTDEIIRRLHDVGLMTIGEVLALPRELLPARFGLLLSKRIAQLTGELPEPLVGLVYDPPVAASHRFDIAIDQPEQIAIVFEKLLDVVLRDLIRRGHGVRTLQLMLKPDRGWGRPMVSREITLSRPHRHRKTLLELIGRQMERIDCEHGFIAFRLAVSVHEPIIETQSDFCEGQSNAEQMEFELLLQRLRARLGDDAVIRPQLLESYIPERAWRPAKEDEAIHTASVQAPPRPMTLFPTPIEILVTCEPSDDRTGRPRQFTWKDQVHRLIHIVGPERISCEWWRGGRYTRDYFDVEDDAGRRFWIFRAWRLVLPDQLTIRWFLHGRFD